MKYLLLIALLLLYLFGLKRVRPKRQPPPPAAQPVPEKPQQMVSCAECGLHMPADEALPGLGGMFCSSEHRAAFEERRGPY
ncbi:MAG: hypothetical protein DI603_02280 [Roseateles depolymerans]|uniref:Deaminase n=1 Tax=Roseateles depolymerans TaxID=76731 RepID=A0A2W5FRD9_9BURK|nr:MAG: hypothetical protein DI603_02280 [Roseateles depolymerans]